MLRIVPHTVPRVGRSYENFPDGFELHLLRPLLTNCRPLALFHLGQLFLFTPKLDGGTDGR